MLSRVSVSVFVLCPSFVSGLGVTVLLYVVCERPSVMHQPARLPEIFDQILQNTPVLEFGSKHPPPPKIEIVPRVQV